MSVIPITFPSISNQNIKLLTKTSGAMCQSLAEQLTLTSATTTKMAHVSTSAGCPLTVHIVAHSRVLLSCLVFSFSPGPVLLDEFVEWYKDKQMSQDFMHSSARVTVTTVMSTISHKLLFVSKRMLLFLHCLPFAGTFLVFAIEWASSACCVALFSWEAAFAVCIYTTDW